MRLSSLLHAAFPVLTLAVFVSTACLFARGLGRLAQGVLGTRDSPNSSRDVLAIDPQPQKPTQLRGASEFRGALPIVVDRGFLSAPDCDTIAVHGRRVGVRLFGVRAGTWLSALGVQNGDRIESFNGFNCAEPEKLLEAYARLRTASDLHVKLTRRGAPAELAVHIR